jgi:uncharacterized protein (TIGR02271 family)
MTDKQTEARTRVPLAEEVLSVGKRLVETGRVRISTKVEERFVQVAEDLVKDEIDVEYVDVDREVDVAPEVRTEGDTLVIPLVEEVLVVERRLVVRQELRLTRRRRVERFEDELPLRRVRAEVERLSGTDTPQETTDENPHRTL